jgi:hypothetical protein
MKKRSPLLKSNESTTITSIRVVSRRREEEEGGEAKNKGNQVKKFAIIAVALSSWVFPK